MTEGPTQPISLMRSQGMPPHFRRERRRLRRRDCQVPVVAAPGGLFRNIACLLIAAVGLLTARPCFGAASVPSLTWSTNQNRVSADIQSTELLKVLERIASSTGWQIFVEPETFHTVSAKFKNLPPGEALRLLLGDVNYALIPGTNAASRLFVFRTARQNATELVRPSRLPKGAKLIANELIVRLKPGANIDEMAKQLGAKVVGRIDKLGAYRLQFENEERPMRPAIY
jgi:hypothetical protein